MREYLYAYLKAREELRKSYETDDWDYINACQVELLVAKARLNKAREERGYGYKGI